MDNFVKTITFKPTIDLKQFKEQTEKISNSIKQPLNDIKNAIVENKSLIQFKKILTESAKIFRKEFTSAFVPEIFRGFIDSINEMKDATEELKEVEEQIRITRSIKPTSSLLAEYEQLKLRRQATENEYYERLSRGEDVTDTQNVLHNIDSRLEGFEYLIENNPQYEDIKEYLSLISDLEQRQTELSEKTKEGDFGSRIKGIIGNKFNDLKELSKSKSVSELILNAILLSVRKFIKVVEQIGKAIVKLVKDSLATLQEMAKYSSQSYIMSSSIREQMLQYGFTPAQNYAFSQASNLLGINSEEDLYWGLQTSSNFREKFTYYMERFSKQFEQQNELSVEYQEFQLELKELKLELQRNVIQFLVNNKSLIVGFLKTSMSFMKATLKLLTSLVDFFGGTNRTESERMSGVSDILSSYSISNSNSNVKVDNTYNINGGNPSDIQAAIKRSYSTVINALKGA